jgi:antigen flippase
MSLAKASLWTACRKLPAWPTPAGPNETASSLTTNSPAPILTSVDAGAGIFNGVTKLVAQHHDDPPRLKQVVGTSSAMDPHLYQRHQPYQILIMSMAEQPLAYRRRGQ